MKILKCNLLEPAKVIEINNDLESMQHEVEGMIEMMMPWSDPVALICNEEGKIHRLPPNRGIANEGGKIMDIICGPCFLCLAPEDSDDFESLPDELIEKYTKIIDKYMLTF